jgi:hypothetical protein
MAGNAEEVKRQQAEAKAKQKKDLADAAKAKAKQTKDDAVKAKAKAKQTKDDAVKAKAKEKKDIADTAATAGTTNLTSVPISPKLTPDDSTRLESEKGDPATPAVNPSGEKGDPDALKGSKDFWDRFFDTIFAAMDTKTGRMFAAAGKKLWEKTPESIKEPIVKTAVAVNNTVNTLVVKPGKWVGNEVVVPLGKVVGVAAKGLTDHIVAPVIKVALSPIKGTAQLIDGIVKGGAHVIKHGPKKSAEHASQAIGAKKKEIRKDWDKTKKDVKAGYDATERGVKAGYDATKKGIDATTQGVKAGLDATGRGAKAGYNMAGRGVKATGSALSHAATAVKEKLSRGKDQTPPQREDNSQLPAHARQRSLSNSQPTPPLNQDPKATAKQKVGAKTPPPSPPRKSSMSQ